MQTSPMFVEVAPVSSAAVPPTFNAYEFVRRMTKSIGIENFEFVYGEDDEQRGVGVFFGNPEDVQAVSRFLDSLKDKAPLGLPEAVVVTAYKAGDEDAAVPPESDIRYYRKQKSTFMVAHTESSVVLTHLPTGTVARVSDSRNRETNYRQATRMLVGKLVGCRVYDVR